MIGTVDILGNASLEDRTARRPRLAAIDAARGIAVLAMVVYHAAWDLSEVRLIETDITVEPGWRFFARAIASSFLLLVGIGLVLAHRGRVRRAAFFRRLATIAGAAAIVTVATVFAFPASYIFFGILHAIAFASLLALPFTQAPAWMSTAMAAPIAVAPLFLVQPVFDAPILAFLGLGTRLPVTNDWVPVFPWAVFVFAGIALARLGLAYGPRAPALTSPPGRALAFLGRHSLLIYLLHQPLLFGAAWGLASLTGPNPAAEAGPFLRSCAASCAATGQPEPVCRATCVCTVDTLRSGPIWAKVVGGQLSADEHRDVGLTAAGCFARFR